MTNRERFQAVFHFEKPDDRLPMIEWASWWGETLQAWQNQGLSRDIPWDGIAPALGLDRQMQFWLPHRAGNCPQPAFHGGPLMETEEDKEQVRIDEEKEKQFDKIFSWLSLGILVGIVGFVIWKILDAYLF